MFKNDFKFLTVLVVGEIAVLAANFMILVYI